MPSRVVNLGPGEVMYRDWISGSRIGASTRGSNIGVGLLELTKKAICAIIK